MKNYDKRATDEFALSLRIPYVTHPLLAFLFASGMTLSDISRTSGISRRTLLGYQLSRQPGKRSVRRLSRCITRLVHQARLAKKLGSPDKYTHLYHDHLDTYIAWGEYIVKLERNKHDQ